jgi:CubicO group peptidase (beta-lactamase class C family)
VSPHALILGAVLVTSRDTTWARLARVLDSAIAHRAFPGAVLAVGRHDTMLYLHAFGRLDYEHRSPATTHTVYDLASLTKVVGLTTAMMQLVEQHRVELDAPAVRYVPAFHDSAITVRQLLTHSSGLPAWKPFYQRVHSREEMFALVNAEPLEQPPGTKMAYSDLGAMVLTQIVEHVTGEQLDRLLRRTLFTPLGMKETRYLPPRTWLRRIAPTEMDTTWRHRMVRGDVHDENAASMRGVSGHAGLFGTAPDLARFAQMLLRGGTALGRRARLVDSATVAMFTRVQQPGFSSRALGWDTPSEGSSAGTRLSARAFGHTGFTGTSMWLDPEQDLFVILLTNRVHPTRDNTQIRDVRRAVADTAVDLARAAHR